MPTAIKSLAPASAPAAASFAQPGSPLATPALQSGAGNPTYRPANVNAAFSAIRRAFEENVIWRDDLNEVSTSVGALSAPERRSLVNLLARTSDGQQHPSLLTRWLDRSTERGWGAFDGLDPKKTSQLWRDLVPGQDKANLARVFFALSNRKNPSISAGENERLQFVKSIAASGTPRQKLDFVSALIPNTMARAQDNATNISGRATALVMANL